MSVKVERSESLENTCPVCHDQIEVYAIGPCDHPVCYRCSTRMRVLCEQMDCPICRSQMPQVAFVYGKTQFKDVNLRNYIPNRKYKIFFEDEEVEDRYLELLEFRCRICRNRSPDKSFAQLQTHMRRDHQLFACDLCVSHLKIFPFERKFYTRKYLASHRRVGDSDDKSYKGHPLCEFCDARYNDRDELHKHLRKDHFYCHFCDQEGSNTYYDQYPDLVKHFSESHFLCTEGDCANADTRFTHAFASEIDLKAHKASTHNKNWSKAQSREARTIELDFHLPPRRQGNSRREDFEDTRSAQGGRGRGNDRYNRRRDYDQDDYDLQRAIEASKESSRSSETTPVVEDRIPDPVNDFPTLNGAIIPATAVQNVYNKPSRNPEEDFPSLSSNSSAKGSKQQPSATSKAYSSVMNFQVEPKPAVTVKKESKPVSLGSVAKVPRERWSSALPKNTEEEYPSLGGSSSNSNSIRQSPREQWSSAAPKTREEDYPALGGSSSTSNSLTANGNSSGWIVKSRHGSSGGSKISSTLSDNNHKRKISEPISRTITDENEFPSLSGQGQNRNSGVFAKPFTDWTKQNKNSSKKTTVSKAEKCDDESFELPESYYKSYDATSSNEIASSPPKATANTSEVVEAAPQPVPVNTAKEFPGLPMRESQPEPSGEKKKKKKNKKAEDKSSAKSGSKTTEDTNASLSEIALALVKPGKGQDAGKNGSRPPKPTDWFDNPPTDPPETSQSAPNKVDKESPAKKSDVPVPSSPTVDSDSFPSLHAMSISVQQPKPPPGFSSDPQPPAPARNTSISAPPGFKSQKLQSSTLAPPPGFTRNAVYIQPAEFKTRNLKLIEDIRQALVTIEDGFSNFKVLSGQFRQGMIEASDYYFSCQALMGDEDFIKVFPELLALLPDIRKQCELWDVHQAHVGKKSSAPWTKAQKMSQCQTCGQVMLKPDVQHHELQHDSHSDFPTLGDSSKTSSSGSSGAGPDIQLKGTWIKAK